MSRESMSLLEPAPVHALLRLAWARFPLGRPQFDTAAHRDARRLLRARVDLVRREGHCDARGIVLAVFSQRIF